jgi:hypothetical protein
VEEAKEPVSSEPAKSAELEKPKSEIEKQIETKAEGPKVPTFEKKDDIF